MPTLVNAAIPDRCILAMEWSYGQSIDWVGWNAGQAFGCTTMGGMTGKPDWGVRHVRHMYAKYGGNNVVFGDLHVASIEPRMDHPYFYAFGENPTGADPRDLYPNVAFYFKYGAVPDPMITGYLHVALAWTIAH